MLADARYRVNIGSIQLAVYSVVRFNPGGPREFCWETHPCGMGETRTYLMPS